MANGSVRKLVWVELNMRYKPQTIMVHQQGPPSSVWNLPVIVEYHGRTKYYVSVQEPRIQACCTSLQPSRYEVDGEKKRLHLSGE